MKRLLFCILAVITTILVGCNQLDSEREPGSSITDYELSYIDVTIFDFNGARIYSSSTNKEENLVLPTYTDFYLYVYAGPGSAILPCEAINIEYDNEIIDIQETEYNTMYSLKGLKKYSRYEVNLIATLSKETGKTAECTLCFTFI